MRYALALLLLLAACGGDSEDDDSAEAALLRQFGYIDKGQWGREWEELHPAHQEIVSKEQFEECAADNDFEIDAIEIVETYPETVTIPGTDEEVESTALTVELKLSQSIFEDELTDTYHEVLVDGEWRWLMSDPEGYANGGCPE